MFGTKIELLLSYDINREIRCYCIWYKLVMVHIKYHIEFVSAVDQQPQ